jgi:hypothetical protein
MGALLMLAPLVAVPILAVVGIPQFAPGNLIDANGPKTTASVRDSRALAEPRFGDAARHDADDLFAPLDESGSGVEGFDDALSSRRSPSRNRNPRREEDDQFAEEAPRSRSGKRSAFNETSEGEFEENSTDSLSSDDQEEAYQSPPNRRRPRSKSPANELAETGSDAAPFEEFEDQGGRRTQPRGERFADASSDFNGSKPLTNSRAKATRERDVDLLERQAPAGPAADEGNPFEAPPATNNARPSGKKLASRGRDPRDAPLFQPEQSAPETPAEEAASFEAPPAPKAPKTARRSPPAVVPAQPPEVVEEVETAPEVAADEQVPGIDELTWQAATKKLRALGVGKSKQYFTYVEDRNLFLFTCSAIHSQDSKRTQRFEAEAEEPLLAVRQVLEKLETWQASSGKSRAVVRGQE